MDDLERQMEYLRNQMQRTLGGVADPNRRGPPLRRLLKFLPYFPGRARNFGDGSEDAGEHPEGRSATSASPDALAEAQETTKAPEEEPRQGFISRLFGG
jgi:hypothetical protein